ncbi:SDR family NAD(P)-dependent oxidoreductase [Pannonibacter sp.]|uniref:SDR family NAD(P)-dependent oxidoreductase n=1 Tax=Pannonibacter sp. TaxID=1906786 RepID=UPI003F71109C
MFEMFDLSDRTVLVTGGARGIGRELTRQLTGHGARVLIVGRNADALQKLVELYPDQVFALDIDLANPNAAAAVSGWVAQEHPDLSVVINNAAIMRYDDLTEPADTRAADIAQEIAINLTAPLQLSSLLLPTLARCPRGGAIVNISSGLAIAPKKDAAVYCATKAALSHFSRALRDQCRAKQLKVRVFDVLMTLVDTTLSRPNRMRKYAPEAAARDVLKAIAQGREEVLVEKVKLLAAINRLSPSLARHMMRGA